eukprot:CAMPEP_0194306196 /NCGR_PEP_ID=MMETSP0171-20130528/3430_1 /TAXON_ID=218684 /ORGANISM="Corethron pennatum, Strain L29A3" /LENGTH=384 /DNA_ID=CAMNT_0039057929 /DNA_START=97 /DNA_END=1248 /DNA_ORIENTATION=-
MNHSSKYSSKVANNMIHATVVGIGPEPVPAVLVPSAPPIECDINSTPWPVQEPSELTPSLISQLNHCGLTKGLAMALRENALVFPLRVWIIDNSGSMNMVDGHRIVESSRTRQIKIVEATRWEQVLESVNYHAQMASFMNAPTTFRLLNRNARIPKHEFTIAQNGYNPSEVSEVRSFMSRLSPGGMTPLTAHIDHIRYSIITPMISKLRSTGQKVSIIIATDGLPTNQNGYCNKQTKDQFIASLRSLEGLPVWIVIRLCTDEEDIVDFYKEIDKELELSVEVLSDYICEAEDVYDHNKWLNYGLPLHRCRELGFDNRLFELMNERALTKGEIQQFCSILFGGDELDGVPDPYEDFDGFLSNIDRIMESSDLNQFNPITKKIEPW